MSQEKRERELSNSRGGIPSEKINGGGVWDKNKSDLSLTPRSMQTSEPALFPPSLSFSLSTALSDSQNMRKVIGGHTDWKCYSIAPCIVYFQCWKTILWLAADQGHVKQTLFHSLVLSFCPDSFCSPRWNLLKYLLLLWAAEENANWFYYFASTEP